MALPLVSTESVAAYFKKLKTGFEVFQEYAVNKEVNRHGIYINDPSEADRTPYKLAVNYGGNIYEATDQMLIVLVTFQDDKNKQKAELAITDIVNDNVLLNGYHRRTYTMEQTYLNRAEYRTYSFQLTRLEFQ
ncbi:hypothetical protein UFOVP623_17 [uncultured Caudovirales phage]|uniref:Tail completion protein n=1 Tax=uncultured Caudovirales phage TaxID=2100421 RepID=A0A6J5N5R0_9CAUD|nr:hypothetical protein UFOVP623_17 [uncultured Caudovirales phage]